MFPNLGEQGDDPLAFAFVVLGFGGAHCDPVVFPIHVGPAQGQGLARDAQPAESGEGDQQPPFGIGGRVDHLGDRLTGHEHRPGWVDLRPRFQSRERVGARHVPPLPPAEDLPGVQHCPANRRRRIPAILQARPPCFGVGLADCRHVAGLGEVAHQRRLGLPHPHQRRGLHVHPGEKLGQQPAQRHPRRTGAGIGQPDTDQPGVHGVGQVRQPTGGIWVERRLGQPGRDQVFEFQPEGFGGLDRDFPQPHRLALAVAVREQHSLQSARVA
ncbi:MAG: hypothetical protein R3B57_10025 [Phycisphaerales bacterium]